jgi:hypothetical protein
MKWKKTRMAFSGAFGLSVGFWLYGIGRTMRETVQFNTVASLAGLLVGAVFPIVFFVVLVVVTRLLRGERVSLAVPLVVGFATCVLLGNFISECWILRDETLFSIEAKKTNGPYSRPRVWPNQTCALIFEPEKGIHSTD